MSRSHPSHLMSHNLWRALWALSIAAAWAVGASPAAAGQPTSIEVVIEIPTCDANRSSCAYLQEPVQEPPLEEGGDGDHSDGTSPAGSEGQLLSFDSAFTGGGTSNVFPHNGQFIYSAVDLQIPGRGIDFRFKRTYKSQIAYDGPLGFNWEHNYNTRLLQEPSGDILHLSGAARADRYVNNGSSFTAPTGFFTQLRDNGDDTFTLAYRDGTLHTYDGFTGSAADGALASIRDRDGNKIRLFYDGNGRLASIRDTLDREILFRYDAKSRLEEMEDFLGRIVKYGYDGNGDLTSVTSPSVTGTPNGNDFPLGKKTEYTYHSGFLGPQAPLNHNLLIIKNPNEVNSGGPPVLQLTYGTNDLDPLTFDRVTSKLYGGLGAGGTLTYAYVSLDPCTNPNDLTTACRRTTIADRVGNVTEYEYNRNQNLLTTREFTSGLRPTEPAAFVTTATYDGELLGTQNVQPEGNTNDFTYDTASADRFQQSNLLVQTRTPDARGGDQTALTTVYTYEPIYNQVKSECDPRGSDGSFVPPVDPGSTGCGRYTTVHTFDYEEGCDTAALAAKTGRPEAEIVSILSAAGMCGAPLGDVNGDGVTDQINGNIIRMDHPTVHLRAGSNQATVEGDTLQEIVELFVYNDFGQLTKTTDPAGNVDEYFYHPENDPDGDGLNINPNPLLSTTTGGYRSEVRRDTTGGSATNIRMQYSYDRVGNVTRSVDGRGIATDYVVNELNQVVQQTRAAAHGIFTPDPTELLTPVDFAYVSKTFYDFNDNVVEVRVEDRGNTSNTGGFVSAIFSYDILDDLTQLSQEVSVSKTLITQYEYDANQNGTKVTEPEGNFHTTSYDERDLVFTVTRGAGGSFGGTAATTTYHYDKNGNLVEVVDAGDTDSSAGNSSPSGGAGDRTRYLYDGLNRRTSVIDAVGNQTVTQYDPVGNVVSTARFGPVGGASPTSDGGAASVPVSSGGVIQSGNLVNSTLMAAAQYEYDDLNRAIEVGRALFVNTIATVRTPDVADGATDIGKGDLTPGDTCAVPGITAPSSGYLGCVSTRTEYDRDSRKTFVVEDDGDTYKYTHDGADRVIQTEDPEGNTVETAYDDNHNVIETRETDVSQVVAVADEIFLTTYLYDSLNRLQQRVDNVGQTFDYRYDSRDNRVAMADAEGPTGPAIPRLLALGTLTVNTTNAFGNVTRYFYDGISRRTEGETVLTSLGEGDGTNIGATIEGVKTTTPTPDATQSGDGLITILSEWDDDSRLVEQIDDNGNRTEYTYDNLNRRLTETKGNSDLPNPPPDRVDAATTITYVYDPDNNVTLLTDENGSQRSCSYDALNRRVSYTITRGSGVIGTTATSSEYDGLSRKTLATDNNEPTPTADDSEIRFAYDSLSRVIEETQKIGVLTKNISSHWRAEGLRKRLIYPNSREVDSTYDLLDRLETIKDQGAGSDIATYDHIGVSRVAQRSYPINGTRLTYLNDAGTADDGFDGLRRPIQLRHLRADNSLVVGFTHTHDRMNNERIEEKLHALADSELYDHGTSHRGYDSAYRVTSFERGTLNGAKDAITTPSLQVPLHSSWTLDGVGNWSQVDTETRLHTSFNEIYERNDGGAISILSDDNGNLIDNGTFTFEWDSRNRLRTVTRKTGSLLVATYTYDAAGRRTRKVVANSGALNGTTEYYYDGGRAIEERDSTDSDALVQQYVYGVYLDAALVLDRNLGGGATATAAGDQRLFYHHNAFSHVYALTGDSAPATIEEGYLYDAYGRQTVYEPGTNSVMDFGGDDVITAGGSSAIANPYLYTGRRLDAESALYFYRTRYYDPEMGRFISRDVIGVWGDSLGLGNAYAYVGSSPLGRLDPMGDFSVSCSKCQGAIDSGKELVKHGVDKATDIVKPVVEGAGKVVQEGGKAAVDAIAWHLSASTTMVGLRYALAGFVFDVVRQALHGRIDSEIDVSFRNNTIQFEDNPLGAPNSAITFGHVIIYHKSVRDTREMEEHELAHVDQAPFLGDYYIQLHGTLQIASTGAHWLGHGRGTDQQHGRLNFLEWGPQKEDPTPFSWQSNIGKAITRSTRGSAASILRTRQNRIDTPAAGSTRGSQRSPSLRRRTR